MENLGKAGTAQFREIHVKPQPGDNGRVVVDIGHVMRQLKGRRFIQSEDSLSVDNFDISGTWLAALRRGQYTNEFISHSTLKNGALAHFVRAHRVLTEDIRLGVL